MKKQTNVRDEMREALYKRAIGYEVEETKIIVSKDGRPAKIEKIRKHVPGEPRAMLDYMRLFGGD